MITKYKTSLLIWQECKCLSYELLKKWHLRTLGELKTITFFLHKREDREITTEEKELLTAWNNGERTGENIII